LPQGRALLLRPEKGCGLRVERQRLASLSGSHPLKESSQKVPPAPFSLLAPTEAQTRFVSGFESTQGRKPGVFEAIAYDVASLADVALGVAPQNRSDVRQALAGVNLNAPVSGGHRFDDNRELQRELTVLTIGDEGIAIWAPEPEEEEEEDEAQITSPESTQE